MRMVFKVNTISFCEPNAIIKTLWNSSILKCMEVCAWPQSNLRVVMELFDKLYYSLQLSTSYNNIFFLDDSNARTPNLLPTWFPCVGWLSSNTCNDSLLSLKWIPKHKICSMWELPMLANVWRGNLIILKPTPSNLKEFFFKAP